MVIADIRCMLDMKRKFRQWRSTIQLINQTNNHLLSQTIEHKRPRHMAWKSRSWQNYQKCGV